MRTAARLALASLLAASVAALAGVAPQGAPRGGQGQAPSKVLGITAFSFLAGTWSAETDSGIAEEMWSSPRGESLMGCFRWCEKDGATKMVELLSIARERDAVRMRIRHFSDTLAAKEEADKPITLKLEHMVGEKFTFRGETNAGDVDTIVYDMRSDTLVIDITFKAGSKSPGVGDTGAAGKTRAPLHFEMHKLN